MFLDSGQFELMAITSTEPSSAELPGIVLVAVRAITEDLLNFEKAMKKKSLSTLQVSSIFLTIIIILKKV